MAYRIHSGNRSFINPQGGGVEVSFYLHLSAEYISVPVGFFIKRCANIGGRWARRAGVLSLSRAVRNKLGERPSARAAIKPSRWYRRMLIDARARLMLFEPLTAGVCRGNGAIFSATFLRAVKQITFHSWHLLFRSRSRFNASTIRFRLNKEATFDFLPFASRMFLFFRIVFGFSPPFIQPWIRESESD